MKYKHSYLLAITLLISSYALGQKPFVEGTIVYDVVIQNPAANNGSGASYSATYTIIVKGKDMRKELKMDNGYDDILIFDDNVGSIYSLKETPDKKYAIQLSKDNFNERNKAYSNFTMNEEGNGKKIAGLDSKKAKVIYRNGESVGISYTTEWAPQNELMFERFPNVKYLPLSFTYKSKNGVTMDFHARSVKADPVENSLFRIPSDYKIISYQEYKQMSQ